MKDSGEEMKAAYDKLTKDGKTSALHRIPFESGSAEVVASETKKRTELLKESPRMLLQVLSDARKAADLVCPEAPEAAGA